MTVDIKEFDTILDFTMQAKTKGVNIPLFVWGEAGVGKTSRITELAHRHNCHLEILNPANQSPETMIGLETKNEAVGSTETLPPEWLYRGMNSPKRTIYFLDEINRAPKYVLQALFSFINEGRLHTYSIKPGDIVIVAGNPDSNDYEVTGFEDSAWMSRFAQLYFEPTITDVEKYFNEVGVHESILAILKEDSTIVDTTCPNKVKPRPTNRMIEKVGHCLNLIAERDDAENFLVGPATTLFSGMVGADLAQMIVRKAKDNISLPDPLEILNEGKVKKVNKNSMDIVTNTSLRLAKVMKSEMEKPGWKKKANKCLKNVSRYMEHIPKDSAVGFIQDMRNVNIEVQTVSEIIMAMSPEIQEAFFQLDLTEEES